MSFKLSIFTTITRPEVRGDNFKDAIECYSELADEVVVIDGAIFPGTKLNFDVKQVNWYWDKEFSWERIGQQFQKGYEESRGDVVIHADIDFLFHEKDFQTIKEACQNMLNADAPALTFFKYQFILPDRYNLKSRLVLAVNKALYKDRIKFDSGGDLCQPSLDGEYIDPSSVPEARVATYNYEKLLKTEAQIADDQGRMERAWNRRFGHYQMNSDGTNKSAFDKWIKAQYGKLSKPQKKIAIDEHPKYIQETIKKLGPKQWGYSGFDYEENSYVKSR